MERGIDYKKLIRAIDFYEGYGYKYIEVPWTVSENIANITKPIEARNFYVNNKCLVASAEQSFLELSINYNLLPGRYCSMTPAFRDEAVFDRLHAPYFMKLELFQSIDVNFENLAFMIDKAERFFSQYCNTTKAITEDGFDINTQQGIELGSYGIREYNGFQWIYGTGCAEPRLTRAIIRT